jgi:hypothetical protein
VSPVYFKRQRSVENRVFFSQDNIYYVYPKEVSKLGDSVHISTLGETNFFGTSGCLNQKFVFSFLKSPTLDSLSIF